MRTLTTQSLTHSSLEYATADALGTLWASAVYALLEPWHLAGHDGVGHAASLSVYESRGPSYGLTF